MQAEEPQPQQFVLVDQMPDVRAREPRAGRAVAAVFQRAGVAGVARVAEVDPPAGGQRRSRPRRSRRQHAVEHVDPARDHLQDPFRIADAHEVARLVGRQQRRRPADDIEHLVPVLTDREAAEGVAVEVEGDDLCDRPASQLRVGAALRDAEDELPRCVCRIALAGRPERGEVHRPLESAPVDAGRRADVQAHGDVGAEMALDAGDELRREPLRGAVVYRSERDAVVVDGDQRVAEGEHLKAARVGEERAVPRRERVQAAELGDQRVAWPEMEVIRVAQHDRGAQRAHLVGVQRLDRARCGSHPRAPRHPSPRA